MNKFICECVNVEVQSYDNQVELSPPPWSSKKVICVDTCLKDEILYLWGKGVITSGCCCGHNHEKGMAYIGIYPESYGLIESLGYVRQWNEIHKEHSHVLPKSLKMKPTHTEHKV